MNKYACNCGCKSTIHNFKIRCTSPRNLPPLLACPESSRKACAQSVRSSQHRQGVDRPRVKRRSRQGSEVRWRRSTTEQQRPDPCLSHASQVWSLLQIGNVFRAGGVWAVVPGSCHEVVLKPPSFPSTRKYDDVKACSSCPYAYAFCFDYGSLADEASPTPCYTNRQLSAAYTNGQEEWIWWLIRGPY